MLRDPIPSLEQAGWKYERQSGLTPPLYSLYPGVKGTVYTPDEDILNARLEALGEEEGEFREFRFGREDLKDVHLLVVPVCTEGDGHVITLCSPYGELAGAAAWCLYRNIDNDDRELLALNVQLPGYSLTPGEQCETRSPLEQAEKFISLLKEDGLKLVSFDYVLIPDHRGPEDKTLYPAYRLRGETVSGERRTFVVSAVSKAATAYDLANSKH